MAIEIRRLCTAQDKQAMLRQRRAIFVNELGYADRHADPADPLDNHAHLFGAFDGPRMVASVRVNYGADVAGGGFGDYADHLAMHRFGHYFPDRLGMVTRLMIDPPYRAGTLMARIGVAIYEHTRSARPGTAFCLIDCVPPLKEFFVRLGYRQLGAPFKHPTAPPVLPMGFAVYDQAHFQHVRSPLARVCPRHDTQDVDWFVREFAAELRTFAR